MELKTLRMNKRKDKKKEEKKKNRLITSFQHMILKMQIKLQFHLVKTKLITEEKIKYLQLLKFITHQEENQVFNSVEFIE